jgi:hypothetical protein
VRLGTTAFSFTNEWLARRYTLEQLLTRLAELNLGPGLELIGFQCWRRFPEVDAEDALAFRRLVERLGLEPASLGAYADLARRVDRPMTTSEAVEFVAAQISAAEALGFPLLRLHLGIPTDVIESLAPIAERADVTLASEVQGGQTPDDPAVNALLECHDRVRSPNLALALDFSIAMTALPSSFLQHLRRLGATPEFVDELPALWERSESPGELFAGLDERARRHGVAREAVYEARAGLVRFGRQDPRSWQPLVPRIAYVHAKFWELNEEGIDPTVESAELIDVLRDGCYDGVVASEWGGSAWKDPDEVDGFEVVSRHHELCRRLLGGAVANGHRKATVLPSPAKA